MLRNLPIAVLCATLALCAPVSAQTLPNPVVLVSPAPREGHSGTAYRVTCQSSPSAKGTWRQIVTSTYISQQALKYNPSDVPLDADQPAPSVLYCVGSDGHPGTIAGAPASLLMPEGSMFSIVPIATIILPGTLPNLPVHRSAGVPFDPGISLRTGPAGVAVIAPHDMVVYPPGSQLFVGGGFRIEYLPPGQASMSLHKQQLPTTSQNGCTVSYTNGTGTVDRVERYDRGCEAIALEKRWTATTGP